MPRFESRARRLDIHIASVIVRTRMSVFPSCVLKRIQKPLNSVRNQNPRQIRLKYSAWYAPAASPCRSVPWGMMAVARLTLRNIPTKQNRPQTQI
jgi:hypothetical protein